MIRTCNCHSLFDRGEDAPPPFERMTFGMHCEQSYTPTESKTLRIRGCEEWPLAAFDDLCQSSYDSWVSAIVESLAPYWRHWLKPWRRNDPVESGCMTALNPGNLPNLWKDFLDSREK